jgi:hypothetical protein
LTLFHETFLRAANIVLVLLALELGASPFTHRGRFEQV